MSVEYPPGYNEWSPSKKKRWRQRRNRRLKKQAELREDRSSTAGDEETKTQSVSCSESPPDPAVIQVAVQTQSGEKINGATVRADGVQGTTGELADGFVALEVPSGRSYRVQARKDNYQPDPAEEETDELGPGETVAVVLQLDPVTATITVMVRDNRPQAVDGARVTVNGENKNTGADGTAGQAVFTVPAGAQYDVRATKDNHVPSLDTLAPAAAQRQTGQLSANGNEAVDLTLIPLVDMKVVVKDGLTRDPIEGATVTVAPTNQSEETDEDGACAFHVHASRAYTVKAEKDQYVTSRRAPGEQANVNVLQVNPADTTLYLTVEDKLLVIGEGTDFGYAAALADRYSADDDLKQVIATQFPDVSARPDDAPDNLVNYTHAFNVMLDASFTGAQQLARLGPDFSHFEAILFNNPHYGYGGHMGMVYGVQNGRSYHWVYANTLQFNQDHTRFNINNYAHTSEAGTLPDFRTDPPTNRTHASLFRRTRNYRGSYWDYYDVSNGGNNNMNRYAYTGRRDTRGFNDELIRKYITVAGPYVRGGGTREINGSHSYEDWLNDLGFANAHPFVWRGVIAANRPYYADYEAQHTHVTWHPSWTHFDPDDPPNPPQIGNMRRYVIQY